MSLVRPVLRQIAPLNLLGLTSPRWTSGWLRQLAAACVFMLATIPTLGQATQTGNEKQPLGSIHGTLTTTQEDASSGLAGITVKLTTEPPDGNPLTANTDDAGLYEFNDLKPGSYTISINQPGFKPFTKALSLIPGQAAVVDIRVELQTVNEEVEVSETTQSIATEDATTPSVTLTQRQLISLPTAQEKIREVLPVTPGVVKTLDGKLNFKGADENQSLLIVNSARTTDPVTGSFAVPVPTDAVQSFAVYKTPYNATLGSFTGGLTEVETKPPDDGWSFRLKSFIPSVLGKNGSMVGLQEATPGVDFSVPLIKHKLLFSEIFQYDMKKRTVRGLPWPYDISKKQGFSTFSTLEAILSKTHVLTLTVNAYPSRIQHADINALVPQPASNDLNQKGVTVGLTDRYEFSSGAILSTIAQYTRFDSNAHGQGPADMLVTPEGWGGNYFNQWSRRGKEFQVVPAYQFAEKHWLGRHELHVGVDFDHRSYVGVSTSNPVQILRQDGTLAEADYFSCSAASECFGLGGGRVHSGSLGHGLALGHGSGSAFVDRNQWLVRGGGSACGCRLFSRQRGQDCNSSGRGLVLQFAAASRRRFHSQPYSSDYAIRYGGLAERARVDLHECLRERAKPTDSQRFADPAGHDATQPDVECRSGARVAEKSAFARRLYR